MNQIVNQQPEKTPTTSVGMVDTRTGTKIAPQNLGEVIKFAEVMARADIALPKHLRNNPGACMAVAIQAMEWQLSPFAVASKSYSVNGAIAYEAQLIAAVVNTRSGIKGRLKYEFHGDGQDMTCTVRGILDGEECVYTTPRIGDITTKNSPLWKTDPAQQLGYFGSRSWARRHCPEVILGVYDRDEAEEFRGPDRAKDITPAFDPFADDAPMAAGAAQIDREDDDYFTDTNTDQTDAFPRASADEPETPPPVSGSPSSSNEILIRYARDILPKAADQSVQPSTLSGIEKRWASDLTKLPEEDQEKARQISSAMRAIVNGKVDLRTSLEHFAEVLECTVEELGG